MVRHIGTWYVENLNIPYYIYWSNMKYRCLYKRERKMEVAIINKIVIVNILR